MSVPLVDSGLETASSAASRRSLAPLSPCLLASSSGVRREPARPSGGPPVRTAGRQMWKTKESTLSGLQRLLTSLRHRLRGVGHRVASNKDRQFELASSALLPNPIHYPHHLEFYFLYSVNHIAHCCRLSPKATRIAILSHMELQ
jgi:hypothetical protein